MKMSKAQLLKRRHLRIRKKVIGTPERPRLCMHKSLKHIYAQIVDDSSGRTLVEATTNSKAFKNGKKSFCNVESAKKLGVDLAKKATETGVKKVVFDRGGFLYHGCVKALAEAAREGGLEF